MKFQLDEYNRNVSEEELLSDMLKVSKILNKDSLRTTEYSKHGRFSISTIQKKFGNWGKALEKANLFSEQKNIKLDNTKVIEDLIFVATELKKTTITGREYNSIGKFSLQGIIGIFGTWNNALLSAGLSITKISKISDKDLFHNIEEIWIKLGRQPKYGEIEKPFSKYSSGVYENRFGTWRKALMAFSDYINESKEDTQLITEPVTNQIERKNIIEFKHKTKRNPSERLKVQVLMRDGNKCRLCEKTLIADEIRFDHIKPWSKGGETILENLQILCEPHNRAKNNLEYPTTQ